MLSSLTLPSNTDQQTTVTFSYQAVEAWSNQVVEEAVSGTHLVQRKKSVKQWTGPEIERNCSTEEKVGTIIPELTKLPTPKGSNNWERLTRLKNLRDSTIHLKSSDQYVRGRSSETTLYARLLAADPLEFPRAAIAIIKHFSEEPGFFPDLGLDAPAVRDEADPPGLIAVCEYLNTPGVQEEAGSSAIPPLHNVNTVP